MRKDLKSNEIQEVTQNQESADMHTKSKRSKKIYAIIASALAFVLLIGGTFAYFTDYATLQTTGTAGTVKIAVEDNINLLNEDGYDILNPGDMRDAGFTVTNEGNKSVDVKSTITLTGRDRNGDLVMFTGDAVTQSEYDLYLRDDVEKVEGRGYMPKDGALPLEVKSVDGGVITYVLPNLMLNGNSDLHDEVETIDGIDEYSHEYDIVLVFKGEAGNEWQASTINIEVFVDAKQHENISDWQPVYPEVPAPKLMLLKRQPRCPYYYGDEIGEYYTDCGHELVENQCRYFNCECDHYHYGEQVGEYLHVYCEDVKYAYREGNIVYYPYSLYEPRGTHDHEELAVGSYTHVYCEYIESSYTASHDPKIVFYPWELHF